MVVEASPAKTAVAPLGTKRSQRDMLRMNSSVIRFTVDRLLT
jgi:hypothetical protein